MGEVIKSQQTELFWATSASVVNKATAITGIAGLGGAREPVDTTDLEAETDGTVIAGIARPGPITANFNVRRGELAHRALLALRDSGELVSWGVYSSGAATVPTAVAGVLQAASGRVSGHFMGYVSDVNIEAAGNNIWKGTISIQRSGKITWNLMTPEEEIAALFAAGEQGSWFDPSDMSTLFQDAAGTIPVTALEQPVGRMLDKSGRGNHATQATAGARPVLSARVNLLTYSEQFDNVAWLKDAAGVISANSAVAPDGSMTADTLTVTGSNVLRQTIVKSAIDGVYTGSIWIRKLSGGGAVTLRFVANGSIIAPSVLTPDLSSGNWVRAQFSGPSGAFTDLRFDVSTGTPGDSFAIWGAQVQQGPGSYQRINAATDYDATGQPPYLRFDGANSMATASIDFTRTDKVAVIAGVRVMASGTAVIAELTASADVASSGLNLAVVGATFYSRSAAPTTGVVASSASQSFPTPALVLRSILDRAVGATNAVALAINSTPTGTPGASGTLGGNFANAPLFVGRRNNASLPFNGNLYGLIFIGRAATGSELTAVEAFMASRTGVTL